MDIQEKKIFLQQGSALYEAMMEHTDNEVIKRYLAFRIIVNTMSFEDITRCRQYGRMRKIRDVLLAHKQEKEFFEGFRAVDEITKKTIAPLLDFMSTEINSLILTYKMPELVDEQLKQKFAYIIPKILDKYEKDYLSGNRIINNFLCFTGKNIQEISTGDLAGAFYRYNSSKALFEFSQYLYNNTYKIPQFFWLTRHVKLDMLLHAQNMADCAIKDTHNKYSIDGISEIIFSSKFGDSIALQNLARDTAYQSIYMSVRTVRNKLIGHMDEKMPLNNLIACLDTLQMSDVHDLVNNIDKAVYEVAQTHPAINMRYKSGNQPLDDQQIDSISGLKTKPYDE